MDWNLNIGYDPGDETVNFGTRAYAESDGCIYETNTLATFQSENEHSDVPALKLDSVDSAICVSVGHTLTVFTDESCSTVLLNTAFDSEIETYIVSADGNFLIVALANGFLHCLHIPSEGAPVYAKHLKAKPADGHMFIKIINDSNWPTDVLVVCSSGIVFNLYNFNFSEIDTLLRNNNTDGMRDEIANIALTSLCGVSAIAPIRSALSYSLGGQLTILAVGKGIATLPTGLSGSVDLDNVKWVENSSKTMSFMKVDATSDLELVLALNTAGHLVRLCPYTLLTLKLPWENPKPIKDFQVVGNTDSEAFITALLASKGESVITLMSFPSMSEKFSLPISWPSVLGSKSSDIEDIHFMECTTNVSSSQTSCTIAVKAATQTVPKFRLERLLRRKKFEAAETLAKNFGLDKTSVYMARAHSFLEKMQPWSQSNRSTANEEILKCFLNELDKIFDMDFVCNCCVTAIPPDYHVAYSLLEYVQKRLALFFDNNPELESKMADWSASVYDSMLRLETYDLIKPCWDVEEWLYFSRVDLMKEVQACVKQGCLSEAAVIWSRHVPAFKESLRDPLIVQVLLDDIPSWVSLDKILEWLAYFLPPLLEVQVSSLSNIVSWVHAKICGLERTRFKDWPKIGFDYAERTLKLFHSQNLATLFFGLEVSPLRPLVVLRCALAELYALRSKYYIFISLEDFTQSPEDVALLLVDCVDVGLISSFITEYLKKFMLDHKLDGDALISQYIMCVLQNSVGWWHWEEAPWELRIVSLIPHLTNHKIRLECIIATLEDAPVPWSPLISGLADSGLKLKHPLVSRIREKQKQVKTNLILKKYNLRTHISKINRSQLFKFIVEQNHSDMLQDIAQLSQNSIEDFSVVVMQLHYSGNLSKAMDVLRSVPPDVAVKLCPRLISLSMRSLDFSDCNIDDELEFIGAVAACHERAKASDPPGIAHIEDLNSPRALPLSLQEIKNRFLLKRDFDKLLKISDMRKVKCRREAMKEVIQDLLFEVVDGEPPEGRVVRLYERSVYLSRLLMFPSSLALIVLIEEILDLNDFMLAVEIAGYLHDFDGLPVDAYKKLTDLTSRFLSNVHLIKEREGCAECIMKASTTVYKVNSQVCCSCQSESLTDSVQALSWARLWCFVSGQQEVLGQRDALQNWRFTPFYKDPGLAVVLNGFQLVDLIVKAFNFLTEPEDSSQDFLLELTPTLSKLQTDHHDVALLMIFCQMSSACFSSSKQFMKDDFESMREFLLKTSEVLLMKVVASRQFDKHLGLGLLTNMGQAKSIQYLHQACRSTRVDFNRQKAFACLGVLLSKIWKLPDFYSYFKRVFVQSKWGLRLPELGIPAKELLVENPDIDSVLQKLIGSKNLNSSLLQTLCRDYDLDFQSVLLSHLCQTLLLWDPNPLISVNPDGTKDVIERNTQQHLLDQCWELQKNIEDKNVFCKTLKNLWEKINFYHHEVFIVVLELLERHGITDQNNRRLITTFLKSYRRINPVDQEEEEYWTQVFPSSVGIPAIAEFRLPFNRRLIDNSLAVVKKELNLHTYKSWLAVAPALDLPKDKICLLAVHKTVTEEFTCNVASSEWCGTLKNDALFTSVAQCVSEMEDVEQAAATLFFFMNKVPPGLDQVNAANLCLRYANELGDGTYKEKVEKKFFQLSTMQILHLYGLGQPCYLKLVHNPEELIHVLYQHPTILDLCRGTATHSLDINSAVQDISSLYDICLKTLQLRLVSDWLQPDISMDPNTSFDDSFNELSPALRREHHQTDYFDFGVDDDILRARYVMGHGDVDKWALFLISNVYEGEASVGRRLRAIQCLLMLTDEDSLEDLAARTISCIREKQRLLMYVKALENLGLTYSESGFESCDKKELATLLIRTQTNRPRAVSLLVHLCVDYNIKNMTLWSSIFQQLVDLSMMKELEQALNHTTDQYQLWNLSTFKKAWNLILTSPFSKANFSSEEEQETAILHALMLFPKCPVLKGVDVISTIEYCLMIQRPEIASLLLPYIEKSQVSLWREKILSSRKASSLIEEIKKITLDKCINISKALILLPSVSSED